MQGSVLRKLIGASFAFIRNLRLHDAAHGHNVSTDARVDKIIFDLAFDRLWHLTCIDVVYVRLNLLDLQPLVKARSCRMLLFFEDATPTVNVNAAVWCLPFAIDKANDDLTFALVACELDRLDKNLDTCDAQDSATDADVLVDEVTLAERQWENLVEVVEAQDEDACIREAVNIDAN